MARIGFKRDYVAGQFARTEIQALFMDIKAALLAAGFSVQLDTASETDVLRMSAAAGTIDDDVPHWAFVYNDWETYVGITVYAVHGATYIDPAAQISTANIIHEAWFPVPSPIVRLWFACDGREGWWWLVGLVENGESITGYDIRFAYAGTTSRRYPSDNFKGLCARYGLWDGFGNWYPPYALNEAGTVVGAPWTGTWSPFGEGWSNNGQRHPTSVLPRMAVPQFPNRDGGITACVLGEFNEILILTDGFAVEEAPIPGWIAFRGNAGNQPFAVPAPDSFNTGPL